MEKTVSYMSFAEISVHFKAGIEDLTALIIC
jgi:hypothetical protein